LWSDLSLSWQACFELAWEAYCDDCIPIGAVVTGPDGAILSRGRNRIYPYSTWAQRPSPGIETAHAEVEALQRLDYAGLDQHSCALYTTTEPCPMCMGMLYMSGVRTPHYAARDPWAGSVNMLGTTPYLSRKPIKVFGPDNLLELLITGLFVEQDWILHDGTLPDGNFYRLYRETIPDVLDFGVALAQAGVLQALRKQGAPAKEVFETLSSRVK
jgi:tRNA(Arg) A34 adenosine deaminase TadA